MRSSDKERVVVIGGGIAGLAAGIYALLAGFDAEIYEKNAIPGGECIGWNRKGFHIDNCIHWLTGTRKGTELYDVWKKVGALTDDTEYAPIDAFFTSTYRGQSVTLWNDLARTQRELLEVSPEDEEEIRHFIRSVEISKQCVFPAGKPMEMWGIGDYIRMGASMKDFPGVMKEFAKISLKEYSGRFKSPLLQRMLCDYLPGDYAAYSFLVSYATMADGNGGVPMGASLQMSLRMEKRFKELGGTIYYNKGASRIVVNGRKASAVEFEDGTSVKADYVIPAVDTHVLFEKLLPAAYMPAALKTAYENPSKYPAISGFQVAYAVSESFQTEAETTFIEIDPLKVGSRTFHRMYVKIYGYDPVCVRDGRQVMQTCISQFDDDYAFWKSLDKEAYEKAKEELVREVSRRIEAAFPKLQGDLEYLDAWTPLTYERYCNAYHGSYMSFITTPYGKQLKLKGRLKGIDNLYLAGQWTNSPGGLPVAVASGKFAIQRILKRQHRDIHI